MARISRRAARRQAIADSASNTTIDASSAVTWPGPSYCGATSTTS